MDEDEETPLLDWLSDILWSLWAGLSTIGSILFLLAGGLALFGLFIGLPHLLRQRRLNRLTARALEAVPIPLREQILERSRAIGGFPSSEIILATTPDLRHQLSRFGVPPEELVDRLLASDVPLDEPQDPPTGPGVLQ